MAVMMPPILLALASKRTVSADAGASNREPDQHLPSLALGASAEFERREAQAPAANMAADA